ncbi:CrcB family protein [Paenibacillus sp. TRM 82003]|nr:CrcB family protein [Paenibacillus sp. TRM 82003]
MRWAAIALGGALGATARWSIAYALIGLSFPVATALVNAGGAYALGWLFGRTSDGAKRRAWYQGAATGFLGAFTTMSAFGWETASMLAEGRWAAAALYAGGSAVVGPWLAAAGLRRGEGRP